MEDWQRRVVDEWKELSERLGKLNAFLADEEKLKDLSSKAIGLLIAQAQFMTGYYDILLRRIETFKK